MEANKNNGRVVFRRLPILCAGTYSYFLMMLVDMPISLICYKHGFSGYLSLFRRVSVGFPNASFGALFFAWNQYTCKTSPKADREVFGGGLLKTLAKHRENKRQRDHWHGEPEGPRKPTKPLKSPEKPKESLSIATTTHPGTTRDHPRSHKSHFLIDFEEVKHQTPDPRTRPGTRGPLIEVQTPGDRITHTGSV